MSVMADVASPIRFALVTLDTRRCRLNDRDPQRRRPGSARCARSHRNRQQRRRGTWLVTGSMAEQEVGTVRLHLDVRVFFTRDHCDCQNQQR